MNPTKIEWADMTWNPIRAVDEITGRAGHHCVKISPGCDHCYAEAMNRRFGNKLPYTAAVADRVRHEVNEGQIRRALHYRGRRKLVFVCSMTDLFLPAITFGQIDRLMEVIAERRDLDFIVLTKRVMRMNAYMRSRYSMSVHEPGPMAPVNLWLGVSVSTQAEADAKIPILLDTPAAHRLVSIEPMLEPIAITDAKAWTGLDWIIVGCETGPGARKPPPMAMTPARVPLFIKPPLADTPPTADAWPENIRCLKKENAK